MNEHGWVEEKQHFICSIIVANYHSKVLENVGEYRKWLKCYCRVDFVVDVFLFAIHKMRYHSWHTFRSWHTCLLRWKKQLFEKFSSNAEIDVLLCIAANNKRFFFWLDINQTTIIWQCTQAINSLCLSESLYRVHWSDCMAQDINGQCGLFPDSFFIPPVSHLDPFCEYNVNGCNFEISSADAACSSAQWMECRGGNVAKKQCE